MNTLLKNSMLLSAGMLAGTLLSGCVITERTYVRDDRPHYVEPAPVVVAPAPPGVVVVDDRPPPEVIVRRPRPPVIVERPGPAPRGDYVWVAGYYEPAGGDWRWHPGEYRARPRPGAVWVEPRYVEPRAGEVHVTLGFWR